MEKTFSAAPYENISSYERSFLNRGYHDKNIEKKLFFPLDKHGKEIQYNELEFYQQNSIISCAFNRIVLLKCSFRDMIIRNCYFDSVIFENCSFRKVHFHNCIFNECLFLNTRSDFEGNVWSDCYFSSLTVKSDESFCENTSHIDSFRSNTYPLNYLLPSFTSENVHSLKKTLEEEKPIVEAVIKRYLGIKRYLSDEWPVMVRLPEGNPDCLDKDFQEILNKKRESEHE